MTSALHGAATCGRCAAPVTAGLGRCAVCGVRLEGVAAGSAVALRSGPLVGVVPARPARRSIAVLADLALVVLVGAAVAIVTELASRPLAHDVELTTAAGLLAALVTLAAVAAVLRATGRTPGRLMTGLRTVDALSGLPPRSSALVAVLTGRNASVVTADLRSGRDPIRPRLETVVAPADLDAEPVLLPTAPTAPSPTDAAAARLVLESGDELLVDGPILVGRAPEPVRGVTRLQALPDLTRGIAKTHLLVDWSNGLLWVTDLGSPGGTTVRSEADVFQPLVPQVRTAMAPGWQLLLGGRTLTVRSVAEEEVVASGR
jgi:hypothetical protein